MQYREDGESVQPTLNTLNTLADTQYREDGERGGMHQGVSMAGPTLVDMLLQYTAVVCVGTDPLVGALQC